MKLADDLIHLGSVCPDFKKSLIIENDYVWAYGFTKLYTYIYTYIYIALYYIIHV